MMICQECQKKTATIHLTKVINGEKTELHLCEACAKAVGGEMGFIIEPNFTFQDLIAGMFENEGFALPQQSNFPAEQSCRTCGLTLADFRRQGLFGCGDCYRYFNSGLDSLFKRVNGGTRHVGKLPKRVGGELRVRREMEQLKQRLQRAIANEEYEEAAKLRDEIRTYQSKLDSKGGTSNEG